MKTEPMLEQNSWQRCGKQEYGRTRFSEAGLFLGCEEGVGVDKQPQEVGSTYVGVVMREAAKNERRLFQKVNSTGVKRDRRQLPTLPGILL